MKGLLKQDIKRLCQRKHPYILLQHSRGSFINRLLFVVLKNDYQAHSISAANILISLFKSLQSTGKIYFQYPQAYWEPRAFFSSLCNESVTVAISVKRRSLLSKHLGKNGSSGSTNLYFYSAMVTKYSLVNVS